MENKTVGIPQALLYHYYHPLWITFFQRLGFTVVLSGETNKALLNSGISAAVDEACLPVKVFYGHVLELAEKVDYLFLPRMVSVERKEYMCPKLLGLPDMILALFKEPPRVIDVNINLRNKNAVIEGPVKEIARVIDVGERRALEAWRHAQTEQQRYEEYLASGNLPPGYKNNSLPFPVALLGHGYNIFDPFINLNLINKLQSLGAEVRTKEMVPRDIVDSLAGTLPKRMFWTFGKQLIGSGLYYINNPEIKGIIFLASFGCGPDSMVGELLERWARRGREKPFLFVTIDEHSGEAGLVTRIEAFMDMIKRKVS